MDQKWINNEPNESMEDCWRNAGGLTENCDSIAFQSNEGCSPNTVFPQLRMPAIYAGDGLRSRHCLNATADVYEGRQMSFGLQRHCGSLRIMQGRICDPDSV